MKTNLPFLLFFLFGSLFLCETVAAQKQLVLDRYKTKRIRLYQGDEIRFKQHNNKVLYSDVIGQLKDTTLVLGLSNLELPLSEFNKFYFPNGMAQGIRVSATATGVGFLFSAAVHPLISDAFYDARESAFIGLGLIAVSQSLRLLKWRKFKLNKNARIRILDASYLSN